MANGASKAAECAEIAALFLALCSADCAKLVAANLPLAGLPELWACVTQCELDAAKILRECK